MAKRWKRKQSKKQMAKGDLFDVKVTQVTDKKFEEQLLYHIETDRCPYNKKICNPTDCPLGEDGMERCPFHQGTITL